MIQDSGNFELKNEYHDNRRRRTTLLLRMDLHRIKAIQIHGRTDIVTTTTTTTTTNIVQYIKKYKKQ